MLRNSLNNQGLLSSLTEIVHANLGDETFGVSQLAEKAGKSRSHIHRYLKQHCGESVSHFICRLRLEKAIALLQQNTSTVSEIAYTVGFSSPSYFIKCFHEKYGFSPGEYIKREALISEESVHKKKTEKGSKEKKRSILQKWYFVAIPMFLLLGLLIGRYAFYENNEPEREKSIVVLPLEYSGDDKEVQSLASGIMTDILHRLHFVKGLTAKSLISYDRSPKNQKSAFEMIKKINVSYILQGRIYREQGSIRVYVTLIDSRTNEELWREKYEEDLGDIFSFISLVSEKIIDELKLILSPGEVSQVEKNYTANAEAFKYYQKGRFFWQRRTQQDLIKSINYFEQALKSDPTYALAYTGLADAYFIGAWWNWLKVPEAIQFSKKYAREALQIDNTLEEAYATLGGIATYYDYDWESAEALFQKALELNPKYATAHQYYSEYLDIMRRRKEASFHIKKAIDLDPSARIMYALEAVYYYHEEKFDSVILAGEKVLEFDQNTVNINWDNFQCYIHMKKDKRAINEFLKVLNFHEPGVVYDSLINQVYADGGIKAIIVWAINWMPEMYREDYFRLARLQMLAGKRNEVLSTLETASNNGKNFPRIYPNPEFKALHNDPRFITLLQKMNLPPK